MYFSGVWEGGTELDINDGKVEAKGATGKYQGSFGFSKLIFEPILITKHYGAYIFCSRALQGLPPDGRSHQIFASP